MEVEIIKQAAPTAMSAASAPQRPGSEFTAADLAAADQLLQLSVSGGGKEEEARSSSSLSARSVNNSEALARQEEEDDDDAGMVDRRASKRYRLLSELYAATRQLKGGGCKRKSRNGMEK